MTAARSTRSSRRMSRGHEGADKKTRPFRRPTMPSAPARGHLLIPESVAQATQLALRGFAGPDGRHEGIVFWAGRLDDGDQLVATALIPRATHGTGYVCCSGSAFGAAVSLAVAHRLVLLSQVHSHPGNDTLHSTGDDQLIIMAHEGMYSIVIAQFGDGGVTPSSGAGIHQFQDGRWVRVSDPEEAVIVVPASLCQ